MDATPIDLMILAVSLLALGVGWGANIVGEQANDHALQANRFTRAQAVERFLEKYESREMRNALVMMSDWKRNYSSEVRGAWQTTDRDEADEIWHSIAEDYNNGNVDDARRSIHWFFKSAYLLWEIDYLDDAAMSVVTGTNAYPLLFDIVWPLSNVVHQAKVGEPVDGHFDWIKKLRDRFPPQPS